MTDAAPTLQQAFCAFCAKGSDQMDGAKFIKMLRECNFFEKSYASVDADLQFVKAAKKEGAKKIGFATFHTVLLPLVAASKKCGVSDLETTIVAHAPANLSDTVKSAPATPRRLGGMTPRGGVTPRGSAAATPRSYTDNNGKDAAVIPLSERTGEGERGAQLDRPTHLSRGYSGGEGGLKRRTSGKSTLEAAPKSARERTTTPKGKDGKPILNKQPFRPTSAVATPGDAELVLKKKTPPKKAAFKLLSDEEAGPIVEEETKDGFTLVEGFDVTGGRILTDAMKDELAAEHEKKEELTTTDEAYRRMWRQKRAEEGLDTNTEFSMGCATLPAMDEESSEQSSPPPKQSPAAEAAPTAEETAA